MSMNGVVAELIVEQHRNDIWLSSWKALLTLAFLFWFVITPLIRGLIWFRRYQQKMEEDNKERLRQLEGDSSIVYEDLNDLEQGFMKKGMAPISTVTWFEGDDRVLADAVAVLRRRITAIAVANPWLMGKLVQNEETGRYSLAYPTRTNSRFKAKAERALFRTVLDQHSSKVHHNMNIAEMEEACLQSDYVLLWRDLDNMFQVVVVRSSTDASKFGLFVSLSHKIADGDTFYCLYNMLVAGAKIEPMDCTRSPEAQNEQVKVMGEQESSLDGNPGVLRMGAIGVFLKDIWGPLVGTKRYRKYTRYMLVDADKVKEIKQKEMALLRSEEISEPIQSSTPTKCDRSGVKFLSTNDVLTSWIHKSSGMKHGVMAVNLRGRIPGYDSSKKTAGNFENGLYYRVSEDSSAPGLIRQSIQSLRRVTTADRPLNSRELSKGGLCFVTNWTAFLSSKVNLGNAKCRQLVHMPCTDQCFRGGSNVSYCIIFQATPTQVCIALTGTSEIHKRFRKAPFETSSHSIPLLPEGLVAGKECNMGDIMFRLAGWPTGDVKPKPFRSKQ